MGVLKKIFGICETRKPNDPGCWTYSNGMVKIDLNRAGELSIPKSAIRIEGKGLADRILVIRDETGGFHAYKNRCTHMGRRIDPVPETSQVRCCSVMGSLFNEKGEIVSGPGKKNLVKYESFTDGSAMTVIIA
jgi:nitrite reductase/ring-hydroxylating ferredoxin subunit